MSLFLIISETSLFFVRSWRHSQACKKEAHKHTRTYAHARTQRTIHVHDRSASVAESAFVVVGGGGSVGHAAAHRHYHRAAAVMIVMMIHETNE